MINRPSLLQDPDAITPNLRGFTGEPIIWPRYRPTQTDKLKNLGVGIVTSAVIACLWAVVDGAKAITFLPFVTLGLDAIYALVRLASVRAIGFPKLPILYLPFTTIWAVAIGAPAFVYEHASVWGWAGYVAFAGMTAVALLSYRLVRTSTEYQLADDRVSEETATDVRAALNDRSQFFCENKGYLLDPPNRNEMRRIDLATFDGQINELLNHSFFPPILIALLFCALYGGLAVAIHRDPESGSQVFFLTRWLWPALAAILCVVVLLSVTSAWSREKLGLVLWAVQLFANSPPPVKTDKKSSWTPVGPYGHTVDRHFYLFFSYFLVSALALQLLVLAPCFMPDATKPVSDAYPIVGTNLITRAIEDASTTWPFSSHDTALLITAHFLAPPCVCFALVVTFCGSRIQCGHRLFTAQGALTHDSFLFDFEQKQSQDRTSKEPPAKKNSLQKT